MPYRRDETARREFLKEVRTRLNYMSPLQKDFWILTQAQLTSENGYERFLNSLSGKSVVPGLPEEEELEAFCQHVRDGEFCLEYDTHYVEFDSFGSYIDDWEVDYFDPHRTMSFLERAFKGCHALLKTECFLQAYRILEKLCNLEFSIEEHEGSEDFDPPANLFSLADIYAEQLLDTDREQVAGDLLYSFYRSHEDQPAEIIAQEMVSLLLLPICEEILPGDILKAEELFPLLDALCPVLEQKTTEYEALAEVHSDPFSEEGYRVRQQKKHLKKMLAQLHDLAQDERLPAREGEALLLDAWEEIDGLLMRLRYEPYIDDQSEIWEIHEICEKLVAEHKSRLAPWSIRKPILINIAQNDYYNDYGCYDPMNALATELCGVTEQEYLEFADILCQVNGGICTKEAAALYHQHGQEQKYAEYLSMNLGKRNTEYIALINYYDSHGLPGKAMEVGMLALEQCRDDMTDIFLYLIRTAWSQGNKAEAESLYAKARRRQKIQKQRITEAAAELGI